MLTIRLVLYSKDATTSNQVMCEIPIHIDIWRQCSNVLAALPEENDCTELDYTMCCPLAIRYVEQFLSQHPWAATLSIGDVYPWLCSDEDMDETYSDTSPSPPPPPPPARKRLKRKQTTDSPKVARHTTNEDDMQRDDVEDRKRRRQLLEWKEITCQWLQDLGTPTLLPILRMLDALDMPVLLWMVSHEWKARALQNFRQVSSFSDREQLQKCKAWLNLCHLHGYYDESGTVRNQGWSSAERALLRRELAANHIPR